MSHCRLSAKRLQRIPAEKIKTVQFSTSFRKGAFLLLYWPERKRERKRDVTVLRYMQSLFVNNIELATAARLKIGTKGTSKDKQKQTPWSSHRCRQDLSTKPNRLWWLAGSLESPGPRGFTRRKGQKLCRSRNNSGVSYVIPVRVIVLLFLPLRTYCSSLRPRGLFDR